MCITLVSSGQTTGRLTGIIKEKGDGTLVGANILLNPGSFGTISDEEGRFRLSNIASGSYTIEVSYIGYKSFSSQISIAANDHLITKRAKNEKSGNLTIGTGNYSQMRANGFIDGEPNLNSNAYS